MMDQSTSLGPSPNQPGQTPDRTLSETGSSGSEFKRFLQFAAEREPDGTLRAWVDLAEAWRISRALQECGGNRSAAARSLGIGRRTLYAKMDKLGIAPSWGV